MQEPTKYSARGVDIVVYLLLMFNLILSSVNYVRISDQAEVTRDEFSDQIKACQSEIVKLTVQSASKDTQLTELKDQVHSLSSQAGYLEARLERVENGYPLNTVYDLARLICEDYPDVEPTLALAVARLESGFDPTADNGETVGLMQINPRWHQDRADRLGIVDYKDPYGSLLLGVDYLHEIHQQLIMDFGIDDWNYVLMIYNMGHETATNAYKSGVITEYATTVMSYYEEYKHLESLLGTL